MSRSPITLTPSLTPPPPKGCELLRENVYEAESPPDVDEVRVRRKPTMTRHEDRLVGPPVGSDKKYTVVLDLDETVVYARGGPLYSRAYLRDLLRSIRDEFEVIVWTAGKREYAKNILEEINQDHIIQHMIYRHKTWYCGDDYTKDLKKLGRNIDYVIIVENTPDCVRSNPQNGIIVEDFRVPCCTPTPSQEEEETNIHEENKKTSPPTPAAAASNSSSPPSSCSPSPSSTPPLGTSKPKRQFTDRTLLLLQEVLLGLAESGETVPEFLAKCPLLTQQEVLGSDGKGIPTYYLGKRRKRGAPFTLPPSKRLIRNNASRDFNITTNGAAASHGAEAAETPNNRRNRGEKKSFQ